MEWTLLTTEQFVTTRWSGGTTTQLAISPEGADYADRDFLWRLSSAQVELEHSHFTSLPGYDRLLAVLEGSLEIKIGAAARAPLPGGQVCAFDGGVPVESWGRCTDFNLMVRQGACEGTAQYLWLEAGATLALTTALPATEAFPCTTLALYCAHGSISMPEAGLFAGTGQLLLCRDPGSAPVLLESRDSAVLLAASVRSR